MATLEDKILGEKTHYYCSSSESENSGDEEEKEESSPGPVNGGEDTIANRDGSANTGPKGVIKDWQRFKQLEAEKRTEQEKERIALMQKLSLTCRSALDEENDRELEELFSDDFLTEYRKKRMKEMFDKTTQLPVFETVVNILNKNEFLDVVDKEHKKVTVLIHIYEDRIKGCKLMNQCFETLSNAYKHVKFCKIKASVAGLSENFKLEGVPAILAYKGGQLVGNYVKLKAELGDDFCVDDVESFLTEVGVLHDKSCVPAIIKDSVLDNDDDSD